MRSLWRFAKPRVVMSGCLGFGSLNLYVIPCGVLWSGMRASTVLFWVGNGLLAACFGLFALVPIAFCVYVGADCLCAFLLLSVRSCLAYLVFCDLDRNVPYTPKK